VSPLEERFVVQVPIPVVQESREPGELNILAVRLREGGRHHGHAITVREGGIAEACAKRQLGGLVDIGVHDQAVS